MLALAACAPTAEPPVNPFARDCPRSMITLCAIDDTACQDQLWAYVNCLADLPDDPERPSVSVITLEDYLEGLVDTSTNAPDYSREYRALQHVGFDDEVLGVTVDDRAPFAPIAFYEQGDRIVFVDPDRFEMRDQYVVLAHEMAHALQARRGALDVFDQEMTYDQLLAVRTYVEGEADLYEAMVAAALEPETNVHDIVLSSAVRRRHDALYDLARTAPHPLLVANQFPYVYGERVAYDAWVLGGTMQLDARLATLPAGTVDIIAGPLATVTASHALDLDGVPEAVLFEDAFGAWMFDVARARYDSNWQQAQTGWRGERFYALHAEDEDEVAVIWWIRVGVFASSYAFERRFDDATSRLWIAERETARDLVVLVADSEEQRARLEPVVEALLDALADEP